MRFRYLSSELKHKYYCTVASKNVYTGTVNLPSTNMPLRLEGEKLLRRDLQFNKCNDQLYDWQASNLPSSNMFVLHDGPPYANGSPHMGHAINKILKDTILRTKLLNGNQVHYVPGWDCHGLPIELKAVKQSKNTFTPLEVRHKAKNFAKQTIEMQKSAFQSWGIVGNWEKPYKTYDKHYVKNQFQKFYELYDKKLIYRAVKPVYWSPSSRTALAEAELEYNAEHVSVAITVKLQAMRLPDALKQFDNVHLLIWTTTPWTLPGNQAVCFNRNLNYSVIKTTNSNTTFIIATDLIESHSRMLGTNFEALCNFDGALLKDVTYAHPVYGNEMPVIHSSHATSSKGTGLVHTAPAHGPEDFLVALDNGINVNCLVDEGGKYIEEAGEELVGLDVLASGTQKLIELIEPSIVNKEKFIHSYPYDWRTKKPVILRASHQWFIDMEPIKQFAIEEISKIDIMPVVNAEKHRKNLIDQVRKRPYWCISRQRCWGVPIPVFYDDRTDKHIINKDIVNNLCEIVDSTDTDFWWKLPPEQLIPTKSLNQMDVPLKHIQKGQDILDIWFDSGISWSSVLPGNQIADLYLEGGDQFTGWFQSSLITSVALRNISPYKAIYVHGFALDEHGNKMSKSVGNVVDPQIIMRGSKKTKPFGVDTLRWWVACHANLDVPSHVSNNVLKASADEVQKIRSTLRFALGCLNDYKECEPKNRDMLLIDQYMLNLLCTFNDTARTYLNEYRFNKLGTLIINLAANEISALYYVAVKDRLYCDERSSASRLSAQYVMLQIVNILTRNIASIVPHLAEEIYSYLPNSLIDTKHESFFMKDSSEHGIENWRNENATQIMETLLDIRKDIFKLTANAAEILESQVDIHLNERYYQLLKDCQSTELCDIFQAAEVNLILNKGSENNYLLEIKKTEQFKCPRCRKCCSLVENTLCVRCFSIVNTLECQQVVNN